MSGCYAILFADDDSGMAYTRGECPISDLPYNGRVDNWIPLVLDLREGYYADYQGSDLAWRLCSDRLREILDDATGELDVFQWLPVTVISESEDRAYYILHFPEPPDVLGVAETLYAAPNLVIKPAFRRNAMTDHSVFSYPANDGLSLFVTDTVKGRIEAAGCTGLEFWPMRVV